MRGILFRGFFSAGVQLAGYSVCSTGSATADKEVERIKRELREHSEGLDDIVKEKMYARLDNAVLEPIPSVIFGAVGGPLSMAVYFLHP